MPLTRPLPDSTVVITGASSGVGAATALMLAARGANVVLAARREAALLDVAAQCERLRSEALVVPTDVSDPAAVRHLADAAEERFGQVDAWINGAAVAVFGGFVTIPLDELRRVIDVDLMGYVYGARAAVPKLRAAGGGVLLMIGSLLSDVTVPYLGGYSLAKHATQALCDTLRQELRAEGATEVSVCAVLPSSIDTPLFTHAANHTGRRVRPLPPVNPPWRIAGRIIRVLESPRPRAYPGLGAAALGYQWRLAPGLTRWLLTWYASRTEFTGETATRTTGNLFSSRDGSVQWDGGWRGQGHRGEAPGKLPDSPAGPHSRSLAGPHSRQIRG
ncbi:MAG: SDR family NAD(P)-dependent oxidoreductase [Micromonosporaceae bacterium]